MRIEDCISDLGIDRCLEAMSAQVSARDPRFDEILELWTHCRHIAIHSKAIAEKSADSSALPEQAYLVGLLHEIGSLPALFDWPTTCTGHMSTYTGRNLSEEWGLPDFVTESFREQEAPGGPTPWSDIVRIAHDNSAKSCIACCLQDRFRPALPRSSSATLHSMPRSR